MNFAERMSRLGTETAFEVLARARQLESQGRRIVHLEIGEPDFKTPDHIVAAAIQALQDGWHHYTPSAGIPALREAIAEHLERTRGISVSPDQVVVTPGAKPIIFFALLALIQKNDEVIFPNPGFPIYESMIRFAGGTPVAAPLREELEFRMDVEEVIKLATPRTKMVILNSPNNPTGSALDQRDLEKLAGAFRGKNVLFFSDEIYSQITYDCDALSIASLPGMQTQTIILDGFSKTYAMTGWRLGYGLLPSPELASQITRLMINSNSCTAAFTQLAGVAALTGDHAPVRQMVETFRVRRDRVVKLLNEIPGVSCRLPRGAFYVFPNVKSFSRKSSELANLLLHEAGVAALSGTAFGRYGEGYLRLSYATSMELLEEGIGKIAEALGKLKQGTLEPQT
ncbi:MAG: pyridoxal phosphate-dependent aminotransferase [Acidobacteria bacterium]|nr:MAG: pyridoxal phosphate-dependent aminotransferase [Acidobacteriota bacterium]